LIQQQALVPAGSQVNTLIPESTAFAMPPPEASKASISSLAAAASSVAFDDSTLDRSINVSSSGVKYLLSMTFQPSFQQSFQPSLMSQSSMQLSALDLIGNLASADLQQPGTFDIFAKFIKSSKMLYGNERQTKVIKCFCEHQRI